MNELVAGIDLCDEYTQISCGDEEQIWTFPTVLCRHKLADAWYVGEDAYAHTLSGEGNLTDKLVTLVIIDTNFILAYVIWVLNGYYKSIPKELEDAGRIDGCTWFGVYRRIIIPTAAPGFVAVGALSFLMAWDEFLYALVFTQSDSAKTIPVAVSEFSTKFGVDYGMMMTSGVVATIIPLCLALFFQKYIVSGLTSGAVKE